MIEEIFPPVLKTTAPEEEKTEAVQRRALRISSKEGDPTKQNSPLSS